MKAQENIQENLSVTACRKILNQGGKEYSEAQIIEIRNYLFQLAQIDYDVFVQSEQKERLLKMESNNDHNINLKNAA
jgi:hypothetical protein